MRRGEAAPTGLRRRLCATVKVHQVRDGNDGVQEDGMRRLGAAAVLVLAGAMPALAADMPARKAGLWEIKTSIENRGSASLPVQHCIDNTTDQRMLSSAGPLGESACPKRDVRRSGDTVTIDSTCTFKDKTATSHAVITGSFDSAYTMTVTSQSEALPGGKITMTLTGKWLGPCAADQKPGDIIMAGGAAKVNILEQK
jgi:Protein of unknown function (DUF3617)